MRKDEWLRNEFNRSVKWNAILLAALFFLGYWIG